MLIETIDVILLAIAVSVDAYAVMAIEGAMIPRICYSDLVQVGILFGGWQTIVVSLSSVLTQKYIASSSYMNSYEIRRTFGILAIGIFVFLGLYMLWKGTRKHIVLERLQERLNFRKIFRLAIVTSLDSLLAGIALGILGVPLRGVFIPFTIVSILAVFLGVYMGHWFGYELKSNAYCISGTILLASCINMVFNIYM